MSSRWSDALAGGANCPLHRHLSVRRVLPGNIERVSGGARRIFSHSSRCANLEQLAWWRAACELRPCDGRSRIAQRRTDLIVCGHLQLLLLPARFTPSWLPGVAAVLWHGVGCRHRTAVTGSPAIFTVCRDPPTYRERLIEWSGMRDRRFYYLPNSRRDGV